METKKVIGMLISSLVLIFFGFVIPSLLVFGNAEIYNPDIGVKYLYYPHFLVGGIIICMILWFALRMWTKNNQLGDGIGYYSIGEKPSMSFFKNFTHLQLYLISIIFFSVIFLVVNGLGGGAGTDIRFLPQQFTATDNVVFSLLFIVIAENIFILSASAIMLLLFQMVLIKYKVTNKSVIFYNYLVFALSHGIIAFILHNTIYAGSQIAGYVVFLFWIIVGVLNLATGSPYPAIALHQANNLPLLLSVIFAISSYFTIVIGVIILAIIVYIWLYRGRLLGEKKPEQNLGVG